MERNSKREFWLLTILIGLILYNILVSGEVKVDIKHYKDRIEVLQVSIDSTNSLNKSLDLKIDRLHTQIEVLNKDIIKVGDSISVIKTRTNEKISKVDTYTLSDLEQFFADRYKSRLDSTVKAGNSKAGN